MSFEVLYDGDLLVKFSLEEFRVTIELISKYLLWVICELGLVLNTFDKSIIYFTLNVVLMEFSLIISIIIEHLLNVCIHPPFFLVQFIGNTVIGSLFIGMDLLNFAHFLSKLSELLNFWSEFEFSILDLLINFGNSLSNLL